MSMVPSATTLAHSHTLGKPLVVKPVVKSNSMPLLEKLLLEDQQEHSQVLTPSYKETYLCSPLRAFEVAYQYSNVVVRFSMIQPSAIVKSVSEVSWKKMDVAKRCSVVSDITGLTTMHVFINAVVLYQRDCNRIISCDKYYATRAFDFHEYVPCFERFREKTLNVQTIDPISAYMLSAFKFGFSSLDCASLLVDPGVFDNPITELGTHNGLKQITPHMESDDTHISPAQLMLYTSAAIGVGTCLYLGTRKLVRETRTFLQATFNSGCALIEQQTTRMLDNVENRATVMIDNVVASAGDSLNMRRPIAEQAARRALGNVKPTDLLREVIPEQCALLDQYRIDPCELTFFLKDVLDYLHGKMNSAWFSAKGSHVFGLRFTAIHLVVECCLQLAKSVFAKKEHAKKAQAMYIGSFHTEQKVEADEVLIMAHMETEDQFIDHVFGSLQGLPGLTSHADFSFLNVPLKTFETGCKTFHNIFAACKDMSSILNKLIEWMPTCFRRFVARMMPANGWQVLLSDLDYQTTFKEASDMLSKDKVKLIINGHGREVFESVSLKLNEIHERTIGINLPASFSVYLTDLLKRFDTTRKAYQGADEARRRRRTPFHLQFYGKPGRGKSHQMAWFADLWGPCYWKGPGRFFSRYSDEPCMGVDEAYQTLRYEDNTDFNGLISSNPYPLDMPEAPDKGMMLMINTLLSCTNVSHPRIDGYADILSVWRRRHCLIEFDELMPDPANPDGELIQAYHVMDPLVPHKYLKKNLTLKQMREWAVEAKRKHEAHEEAMEKARKVEIEAPLNWPEDTAEKDLADLKQSAAEAEAWIEKKMWCKAILAVAVALPAAYLGWRLLRSKEEITPQAATSYDQNPKRRVIAKTWAGTKNMTPNGECEVKAVSQVICRIEGESDKIKGNMQCLYTERALLMPFHFINAFGPAGTMVHIKVHHAGFGVEHSRVVTREFDFNTGEAKVLTDEKSENHRMVDFCAIPIPRDWPTGVNIRSHFMDDNCRTTECCADLVIRDKEDTIIRYSTFAKRGVRKYSYNTGTVALESGDSWLYKLNSKPGYSGGLLVGQIGGQNKIIGMHSGCIDATGTSIAEAIEREHVDALMEQIKDVQAPPNLEPHGDFLLPPEMQGGLFGVLGHGVLHNYVGSATKIRKSVLFECLDPAYTHPAVLKRGDERVELKIRHESPLYKGCAKQGHPGQFYDERYLRMAIEYAKEVFARPTGIKIEKVSQHVAINGDPSRGLKSMDFTTSPGFGWKHLGTKADLFDITDDSFSPKGDLQRVLDTRRRLAREGIRTDSVWLDCTKDERRPLEKIQAGKTRVFTIGPVDYTILFRENLLTFMHHMARLYPYGPSAVGIDCESVAFHQMSSDLAELDLFFDGDIGNNDGEHPPRLYWAAAEVITNGFAEFRGMFEHMPYSSYGTLQAMGSYQPDFCVQTARSLTPEQWELLTLLDEGVSTFQLASSFLYLTFGALPSGFPGTTDWNTVGNTIQIAYSYFKRAPPELATSDMFKRLVRFRVFGDDFILAVDRSVAAWFNPTTLSSDFSECGRHLTGSDKQGVEGWKKSLSECTFLKQSFNYGTIFPGRWTASLPKYVILDCAYYVRDIENFDEACIVNANQSLRMAFWHGSEYFNKLRDCYMDIFNRTGNVWLKTFSSFYAEFYRKQYDEPDFKVRDETESSHTAAVQNGQTCEM